MDDVTIARCVIEEMNDGPNGPGFYYVLSDAQSNQSEPVGPYETSDAAEQGFMDAIQQAAVDMVKQTLGLED